MNLGDDDVCDLGVAVRGVVAIVFDVHIDDDFYVDVEQDLDFALFAPTFSNYHFEVVDGLAVCSSAVSHAVSFPGCRPVADHKVQSANQHVNPHGQRNQKTFILLSTWVDGHVIPG